MCVGMCVYSRFSNKITLIKELINFRKATAGYVITTNYKHSLSAGHERTITVKYILRHVRRPEKTDQSGS